MTTTMVHNRATVTFETAGIAKHFSDVASASLGGWIVRIGALTHRSMWGISERVYFDLPLVVLVKS